MLPSTSRDGSSTLGFEKAHHGFMRCMHAVYLHTCTHPATQKSKHLKNKSSQGDLKQETYRKHPVLVQEIRAHALASARARVCVRTHACSCVRHLALAFVRVRRVHTLHPLLLVPDRHTRTYTRTMGRLSLWLSPFLRCSNSTFW